MQRKIIFLSETCEGKMHDKKIADEHPIEFVKEITLLQDSGFIGHNPQNAKVKQPYKNSKLKKLTEEQKIENKEQASKRVRVEHVISGIKRLRIVKEIVTIQQCYTGIGLFKRARSIACRMPYPCFLAVEI